MEHPKEVGDRSQLAIMLALRDAELGVYLPFGENTRCDLTRDSRRTYEGQIEFFAVYCTETQGVYLIPIADVPMKSQAALRIEHARNGQKRKIRLAADYEIARVELRATAAPGATPDAAGSCA